MQKITFIPEDDTAFINLSENLGLGGSKLLEDLSRIISYDAAGEPVSVTFLYVSDGVDLSDLPLEDPDQARRELEAHGVKVVQPSA